MDNERVSDILLPFIEEVTDLRGKRVLVRADLNVPIKDGVVTSPYRIKKLLPTLEFLRSRGARTIVVSHLGRDPNETLAPVYDTMLSMIPLSFVPELLGPVVDEAVSKLQDGDIILLENIRKDSRENDNDPEFAKALASLADIYVNEAFSASHRAHSSIVGVPKLLPGYAGLQFRQEVEQLTKAITPTYPSLCIIGGAKFDTKEALLKAVLPHYDRVFIGGAIADDIFRAQGLPVGKSLVSDKASDIQSIITNPKVMLPVDVTVDGPLGTSIRKPGEVGPDESILDIGPESTTQLGTLIVHAATILWNGPLGFFEKGYSMQTEAVARLIAESQAESFVGGGETVASIDALGIEDKFTFVSTGGGAMLDFLSEGTLPGIDALKHP